MKNKDLLQTKKIEILNELSAAVKANDTENVSAAIEKWQDFVTEQIMSEVQGISEATDRSILAARGCRQLTSEETKWYNSLISAAKNELKDGEIDGIMKVMPETIFETVLEDIRKAHPLLDAIDFVNTGAAIKWITNAQTSQFATWDELNTPITKEIIGKIEISDMMFAKLTAFMFVTKDILNLGPRWVDTYVRAFMGEALAFGLENAIVDGDGVKKPVGMTRNFKGAFDQSDGYARKSATSITNLSPATYGTILAKLAKNALNESRSVGSVILIVNPVDYFTKIMPATTMLAPDGRYVNNIFPYPTTVYQSVAVPANHAVIGIAANYFMGVGTGKGGKLEYDDSYKFLEDLRTYAIRFYGNGKPKDINSFEYLDISGLSALSYIPTAKDES